MLKRKFQSTARSSESAGFRFCSLIIEAPGGGFGGLARGFFDWVARPGEGLHGERREMVDLKIARRISCILQRENARAVRGRHPVPDGAAHPASS